MEPLPFKKQEGVGLVEVLVAGAILSLTVGGTILAASSWVKTTSGTSMRNDGSQINGSVMELAAYNPDATWVASQLPTTDAGNTTFTISSLVTTSVGTASATQILAGTAWQDADGDGNHSIPHCNMREPCWRRLGIKRLLILYRPRLRQGQSLHRVQNQNPNRSRSLSQNPRQNPSQNPSQSPSRNLNLSQNPSPLGVDQLLLLEM